MVLYLIIEHVVKGCHVREQLEEDDAEGPAVDFVRICFFLKYFRRHRHVSARPAPHRLA